MDQFARTQGTSAAAREGGEIHPPVHRRGEINLFAVVIFVTAWIVRAELRIGARGGKTSLIGYPPREPPTSPRLTQPRGSFYRKSGVPVGLVPSKS